MIVGPLALWGAVILPFYTAALCKTSVIMVIFTQKTDCCVMFGLGGGRLIEDYAYKLGHELVWEVIREGRLVG